MITIDNLLEVKKYVNNLKVVVFDLDDTLFNEVDYVKSGFKQVAANYPNIDNMYEKLYDAFLNGEKAIDYVLEKEGMQEEKENCLAIYRNQIPTISLSDEALSLLTYLEDKKLGIRMDSPNSSILIGRKGKNLDALQLLANIYAGRLGHEEVRVILDTENYRIRREESLVRLAYTTADKVRSRRNSILLEPMNPFERRLIHTTLNDIPDVETKSEGDGLYKQVRVLYKGIR